VLLPSHSSMPACSRDAAAQGRGAGACRRGSARTRRPLGDAAGYAHVIPEQAAEVVHRFAALLDGDEPDEQAGDGTDETVGDGA
jgi:hypothetical protein